MKFVTTTLALALLLALSSAARAQEPELINEIVARVNNEIITRADYLGALREFREELHRQMTRGGQSEAEVEAEFNRLKGNVLDYMIDDILLEQKAKELGMDVEAEVNQQMAEIAKENRFPNVIEFEAALKKQGMEPEAARANLRKKLLQTYVVQREVLAPIFTSLSDKDRRAFYEKYKDQYFTTPGEVTISEIFLPLEGHTAEEVEQRARRIVAELRAGQSFAEAVQKNTPASRATRANNGKMGVFEPKDLKPEVAKAIAEIKTGDVSEPIRLQDGYQIIRVDERKPSVVKPYEDPQVQDVVGRAATMERADPAKKKYLAKLREEAYIKITSGYETAQAAKEPSK
ncbi:MAG TPA: SurA N-terminal domain-containing protein [Blastocatellia bacterium]|nr:SurA N-terminal domain-containing protein [Blastocatellia bacterium]